MRSIDFRVMYFLILYPSPMDRAYSCQDWDCGFEPHDKQYIFKNIFSFFIINHDLHYLQDVRVKVNVIEFFLKHYHIS